ncbi:hypothetical protein D3C85_1652390 [compost metagenome]
MKDLEFFLKVGIFLYTFDAEFITSYIMLMCLQKEDGCNTAAILFLYFFRNEK